jgi:hypothetical protein
MVTKPRGKLHDLERARVERLADELEPALDRTGQLIADATTLENVDPWRAAVRLAGRRRGWHVRTGVSRGTAWAVIERRSGLT